MTSKISFCIKLIRSDIRHRGWLAALSGTLFFLMMPVYTMLYLSTYTNPASDLIFYFPGLINGLTLRYLAAAIAVLAILSALTGFSWIHSRERLDFFHSLPVKRTTWFTATYLSGLIIVLVPYIVCCVLTIAAGAADTGMTAELAGRSAEAALGGVLAFFIIYNACVFALMLTGRTVTGLLASLAVIVYPFIVFVLISSLETAFFRSFYSDSLTLPQKLAKYLSPFGLFSAVIEQSAAGALGISVTAAVCLMSALFIAAAVLLYRIYPSETAGNAVAFPSISPVLKVLICIPTALFISLMIKNLMMLEGNILLFPLGLLAAVLLCAVIEFIYTMDLKLLLKGWKSSLISIAGVMAVLCFFHLDLPGYDTYIPDKEKIESISFCPDSFSSYFSYPETGDLQETPTGYFAPEEMNDTLYALAQSGIDNLKNGIDSQNVYDGNTDDGNYLSAVFRYRLSGGRTIARQYAVAYEDAAGALEELLGSTEYRKQIFPFFYIDRSSVTSISRDKNHACVVMWSIANEPDSYSEGAYDYFAPLYELARELDPQKRPCTLISVQMAPPEKDCSAKLSDVICLNRYYGWYFGGPDLELPEQALRKELDYWKTIGKPVVFTEYGADTVMGMHDTTPVMYTEEFQVEYYKMNNKVFDDYDFVVGEQVWNFADFATSQSLLRVQGNKKGIFTRDRKPKLVAHYFRDRWHKIPDFEYKK